MHSEPSPQPHYLNFITPEQLEKMRQDREKMILTDTSEIEEQWRRNRESRLRSEAEVDEEDEQLAAAARQAVAERKAALKRSMNSGS